MRFLTLVIGFLCVSVTHAEVRFNRDVRPILADHCFACHGPDQAQRKAKLRFDVTPGPQGHATIKPGKPEASVFYRRIISADADELMPPKKHGRPLSKTQIETLRQWIAEGAKWEEHWAFIPPQRPAVPTVKNAAWVRNPIDAFVLAKLEREGLKPSPEAARGAILRRLSFDLTGLPPTPDEVQAFERDTSPEAYAKVVKRLLASPRYGERMAWPWLEAARYADTNGYQTDAERDMWRWRDWVIDAFNKNMPFNQFTVEQLAGDMLPRATLDQRIATGFNRNHRGNSEGGIVPEEYAAEYVVDRVETTATVWLGLTMGCVRCHDHKYDPFTMRDFYSLYAFFNNVPERGRAVKFGNSPPFIKAPTKDHEQQRQTLDDRRLKVEQLIAKQFDELRLAQRQWEENVPENVPEWFPTQFQTTHIPFDRLQEEWIDGNGKYTPGKIGTAADFNGVRFVNAGDIGNYECDSRFTISFWVRPRSKNGPLLTRAADVEQGEGYGVLLVDGKLHVYLNKRWLDDSLRVEAEAPVHVHEWSHIAVTYDGSLAAKGLVVYINGQRVKTKILADELNQRFATKEPLRLGAGFGERFDGMLDDVRLYARDLEATDIAVLAIPDPIPTLVKLRPERRTPSQASKIDMYFAEEAAAKHLREPYQQARQLRAERLALEDRIPTVMVMEELATPRPTHILKRGEYDKPGDRVTAALPTVLSPAVARTRLDLAKWLVDAKNPLTARVAVNRVWQMYFGTGLVKTTEDFGTQGEYPSHPELLDWLATEFVRLNWDTKALHELIVSSATYRQASRVSGTTDPDNRLLSRGPRQRLAPEMIRDQALFAAGLLVEKQGGPSVKPYQPSGLWKELSGTADYVPDTGEGLYRRSLYTYWKRTAPPPNLANLDAPARETCWVRQTRTNTPIQALTLLNDITFVEAARKLAERTGLAEKDAKARIERLYVTLFARTPTENELRIVTAHYDAQHAAFTKDPTLTKNVLNVGAAPFDAKANRTDLAALTSVCRLLMNLDEFVTKE